MLTYLQPVRRLRVGSRLTVRLLIYGGVMKKLFITVVISCIALAIVDVVSGAGGSTLSTRSLPGFVHDFVLLTGGIVIGQYWPEKLKLSSL